MNSKKPYIWFTIVIFFGLNILFQIFFITKERQTNTDVNRAQFFYSDDSISSNSKPETYEPLKTLSEEFPKIQVVIPTMYRLKTGYTYLKKTFKSMNTSFKDLNVDFTLNAFERKSLFNNDVPFDGGNNFKLTHFEQDQNLIKLLKDPEHELLKLQKKYGEVTTEKIKKWNNQALDWLEMMKTWHRSNCSGSSMFLYLEDDYLICPDAAAHVISLYQWAEMHLDDWLVIRMTFGFSGLFMQCRDIPKFISVIEEKSIRNSFPIDTALALFWDPFENQKKRRVHYTYRYILFEHIGYESSVGNWRERDYKCFGLMKSPIFHYQEQFDWNCENYMLSPCKNPSIKQLKTLQIPYMDVPIDYETRKVLLRRLGHEIIPGNNIFRRSCDEICEDMDMACSPRAFQFVNNCDTMRKTMKVNCRCYNMIDDNGDALPLYDLSMNECKTLVNVTSICSSQRWGSKRMCPCRALNEIESLKQEPRHKSDENDMMYKFHQIMNDFYTKVEKEKLTDAESAKEAEIFKKILGDEKIRPGSELSQDISDLLIQMKKNREKERTGRALNQN